LYDEDQEDSEELVEDSESVQEVQNLQNQGSNFNEPEPESSQEID